MKRRHPGRKRTWLLLGSALTWCALASGAGATQLLYEPFDYPDGNLAGQGGWAAHQQVDINPVQVIAHTVHASHQPIGEDVNKGFATQTPTAKIYAGFRVRVTAYTSGSDYFAHFKDDDITNFRSRVWVAGPAAGGGCRIGISATFPSTSVPVYWGQDLSLNQAYRIVHSWDAATGTAELWLDPVDENSPKLVSGPFEVAAATLNSAYAIRQGGAARISVEMSDLAVGTTFSDAAPDLQTATIATTWGRLKAIYR